MYFGKILSRENAKFKVNLLKKPEPPLKNLDHPDK